MRAGGRRKRVLVVANDRVGTRMAGPGIRAYQLARGLAEAYEVTLLAPDEPDLADAELRMGSWRGRTERELARECARYDAVVAQQLPPSVMRALAHAPTRAVYDVYDPYPLENLGAAVTIGDAKPGTAAALGAGALLQTLALALGDALVCATERQRDLWLGALLALGRIDVDAYRADPSLRALVDVVPFGVEPDPPVAAGAAVLKGVVPAVRPGDRVVLWGGGLWSWLDPLTPLRAVGRLAARRDDVRLVFLGAHGPSPQSPAFAYADAVRTAASELGLLGTAVHFVDDWIPYAERVAYLLEADVGISAHLDTAEARFAVRARLLDYLWAGVPVVATEGDDLAELARRTGAGRIVPVGDTQAWEAALEETLDDATARERARQASAGVRSGLSWAACAERLARVLEAPATSRPALGRARVLEAERLALRVRRKLAARSAGDDQPSAIER